MEGWGWFWGLRGGLGSGFIEVGWDVDGKGVGDGEGEGEVYGWEVDGLLVVVGIMVWFWFVMRNEPHEIDEV